MPSQWWSWLITIATLTGLWLAGSGKRWAWGFNAALQLLWVAYAIVTQQWGFLVAAPIYAAVFLRNMKVAPVARVKNQERSNDDQGRPILFPGTQICADCGELYTVPGLIEKCRERHDPYSKVSVRARRFKT